MGVYYKTLWIRNLREMDRFDSKLVSSDLNKQNTLALYGVCKL